MHDWPEKRRGKLHRPSPMTATIKHKTAAAVQGQTVEEESEVAVLEEMTPMKRRELMVAINICTQTSRSGRNRAAARATITSITATTMRVS